MVANVKFNVKFNAQFKRVRGFTLIEIMVVIVILGILASLIMPKIMSRPEEARIVKAKQDIKAVESALELYRLDNGFYPSTDQGLSALVKQPTTDPVPTNWKKEGYLKKLPMDPWGKPYQYLNPGSHGDIDIFSEGPVTGKKSGKEGENQIGNWSD